MWDATNGTKQYIFEGHETPVYSVCPHHKENIQAAVLYFCFIALVTLLEIFLLLLPAVSIFVLCFLVLDHLFLILCLVHLFNGT